MSRVQLIPRISLIWLLVAQVLAIVPHVPQLPYWVIGLWLVCGLWRVQIFRMRAQYPNAWVKILLLLGTAAGVLFSRGSLIGLDGGIVLLVATFILKMLEMRSRRDALVLIFLGFFIVVTSYLFDDSLVAGIYTVLPVTALLAALIGLQQSAFAERPWATLRLAAGLMLQAVPLMLLLFVFFPRLGPLWSLPQPGSSATVGLAESMTPGDIANLSRSDKLAFRASFKAQPPDHVELYWRALTLEQFDGRRWSQTAPRLLSNPADWQKHGEPVGYSIVMQPSGQNWLFALDVGQSDLTGVRLLSDFRLQRQQAVEQTLLYEVESWPQAVREVELPASVYERNLQLPSGNPRTRAWAQQLRQQHGQPAAVVQALLQHFNQQAYFYTLKPPTLGEDSVDGFLFDSRRGFCAHYAGAMTFALRAAGIPARVVAGYQGGEFNAAGNYVSVHQFDAHAWVEYWRAGVGWQTVDPTFEVAPERIELGLEQALAQEGSFLEDSPFSPLRYRNLGWLNQLRQSWDSLNYGWQRWVLGYQASQQVDILQRWFGGLQPERIGLALVGGGGLLLGLLALILFKPWQGRPDPQQRLFLSFERLLQRHGLTRGLAEGPRDYVQRAAQQLPAQAAAITAFYNAWEAQRYAGKAADKTQLKQTLRRVRRALPWRFTRP